MSYTVAVRTLCEFTAKTGDLDLRFTPSPTAQEGIAGHAVVAARRGAGYQTEVSLSGTFGPLTVRGRADGYDPGLGRLEEIKTYRGDLERLPENHRRLHWAQARIYGWLLCEKLDLAEIRLALVYFDIVRQTETVLEESADRASLRAYFEEQCGRFLAWAEQEMAHRAARDAALQALTFPCPDFRAGQRQLAEAVYRTARGEGRLLAQAPTGIGKTLGTLFPLLKAAPQQGLDRIFFLTAKTPGRRLALDALHQLRGGDGPLRVLELTARDKACEHPDKACHGDACPLANGFYDRLPAARAEALRAGFLTLDVIREQALAQRICPYYLAQELARWCDVAVGDYNYFFDVSALLHGLTLANQWRVGLLVDEAHNLLERGRRMYSAELDQARLRAVRRAAPPALKPALDRVQRQWNAVNQEEAEPYRTAAAVPARLLGALQKALAALTDELTDHPATIDPELQRFYFDALHWTRLAEDMDAASMFDFARPDTGRRRAVADPASAPAAAAQTAARKVSTRIGIRNVVPARFLGPRFAAARTVTLFSATLSPARFHIDLLGLPADTRWLDVESPFRAEQLRVHIAHRISTRYRDRERSLRPIVELMRRQYAAQPGNYLAFFSSFDYLQRALEAFAAAAPGIAAWAQSRGMEEAERERFLRRFEPGGAGIGFAVLGGAFAEGIDLPGERLIGAFIATLGLPQVNALNEEIKQRIGALFDPALAYDYTYLYPGLQKVVQAAGRVIRSPSDRGVVHLMDDRFARPQVLELLPAWWTVDREDD